MPKVEVELLNIVEGITDNERDKFLRIKFRSSRFHLASDFIVHKKVLRRNLVEISAEVVAQTCQDVEDLEIPETLQGIVIEKVVFTMIVYYRIVFYILHFRLLTLTGWHLTGLLNTEEIGSMEGVRI